MTQAYVNARTGEAYICDCDKPNVYLAHRQAMQDLNNGDDIIIYRWKGEQWVEWGRWEP